jgi:hypothetical protein
MSYQLALPGNVFGTEQISPPQSKYPSPEKSSARDVGEGRDSLRSN